MNDGYLLAIDVGTGSVRAVLFTADGKQAGYGRREYRHREIPGVPGSQLFDTTANWSLIGQCAREALSSSGVPANAVRAVSATSMREGMVLYDSDGVETWACPNADSRASEEAGSLISSGAAQEIYDRSGDWVAITAPARFKWIARHEPEVFSRVAHVGMIGDWVLRKLSGQFVTDPSLGSSSGMFDLARREWSGWVLDICGLEPRVFPTIVEPGTVIGTVTARAADETGLAEGTPVVVGGADTQLAVLGTGATGPGRFTLVGGSFWQHTVLLDQPLIDPCTRLRTTCHVAPGLWMMEGIGFSGLVMRWFRDAFCELEQAQAALDGVDAYAIMERKAAELPPGSNGIVALFSNVMDVKHWVHTSPGFLGFDISEPERAGRIACFRAIEEGAAYVSVAHKRVIEDLTATELDEAVLTGGAAKGQLWPQIVADTLGVPVHIPTVVESTSLGAAICAGVGAGFWRTLDEGAKAVATFDHTVEPRRDAQQAYQGLLQQWLQIYRSSLSLVESGLLEPLWRAAGT